MTDNEKLNATLNNVKLDLKDALEILEEDTECDCPPEWPRCIRCRVLHRVRRALRLLEEESK